MTGRPYRFALQVAAATLFSTAAIADDAFDAVVSRGHAVAVAGDCMACHRTPDTDGKPFAGGYTIASPLGPIVAPNITPSKSNGIGNWTEAEFDRAMRDGVAPRGNLYPAMPYTSYRGMSDDDMHALYVYLAKGVNPVDEPPKAKTALPFPFNQRILMSGWNLLFNRAAPYSNQAASPSSPDRGRYLVDVLEHCGACHTPRNAMMAEDSGSYLSGADLGGWHAPNITSDAVSGIGGWTNAEIVSYLKQGSATNKAQAAGGMAEAVEHSLRHLPDSDLQSIAAYLKSVPAIQNVGQLTPSFAPSKATPVGGGKLEYGLDRSPKALTDGSSVDGQELYMGACASCHRPGGQGTADQFYPSLTQNTATGSALPNNLVMTVIDGIHRATNDKTVSMPAFGDEMNDAQIAAISTYVMHQFGNGNSTVSAQDVARLRAGGAPPILIVMTRWLLWGAAIVCALLVTAILLVVFRQRRLPSTA